MTAAPGAMPAIAPMQFAPMLPDDDATGHQAIGSLADLATALVGRPAQPAAQPTDAPVRRKTPLAMMRGEPNYA